MKADKKQAQIKKKIRKMHSADHRQAMIAEGKYGAYQTRSIPSGTKYKRNKKHRQANIEV